MQPVDWIRGVPKWLQARFFRSHVTEIPNGWIGEDRVHVVWKYVQVPLIVTIRSVLMEDVHRPSYRGTARLIKASFHVSGRPDAAGKRIA